MDGIKRIRPQFQQRIRLPFAQDAVNLADQAISAAIGLVSGQAGRLQPCHLRGQFGAACGDIGVFTGGVNRHLAQGRDLVFQGRDAGRVDALRL